MSHWNTNLCGLLLIVVVFFFVTRVVDCAVLLSSLFASLFVKRLVVLVVVKLGLPRNQVAHAGAHVGRNPAARQHRV